MIKRRINIRMSGLGGQGVVTSAHVMAMAASKDGRQAISNPFLELKANAPRGDVRIGVERIMTWRNSVSGGTKSSSQVSTQVRATMRSIPALSARGVGIIINCVADR